MKVVPSLQKICGMLSKRMLCAMALSLNVRRDEAQQLKLKGLLQLVVGAILWYRNDSDMM